MENRKEKIKKVLIFILIFIWGYGAGMIITYLSVLNRLDKYGVRFK